MQGLKNQLEADVACPLTGVAAVKVVGATEVKSNSEFSKHRSPSHSLSMVSDGSPVPVQAGSVESAAASSQSCQVLRSLANRHCGIALQESTAASSEGCYVCWA